MFTRNINGIEMVLLSIRNDEDPTPQVALNIIRNDKDPEPQNVEEY